MPPSLRLLPPAEDRSQICLNTLNEPKIDICMGITLLIEDGARRTEPLDLSPEFVIGSHNLNLRTLTKREEIEHV